MTTLPTNPFSRSRLGLGRSTRTTLVPHGAPKAQAPRAQHRRRSTSRREVLAIGDSVLLAADPALEERLHGDITVDARVGRQVWQGIQRLSQYRRAGYLKGLKALVLDLGTNGPLYPWDVGELRRLAAGVPLVVFVNVRAPKPWQATTNASLASVAKAPGVRVVNWYAASRSARLLWADGVHPDPEGQVVFANLLGAALAPAGIAGA